MTVNFKFTRPELQVNDSTVVDFDDDYVSDAWLIDRYVGNRIFDVGKNDKGQLANNTGTYYSSPLQIGSLTNWKVISYGNYHWHGIKTDGTLWSCGYNNPYGNAGNGTSAANFSSPVQVGSQTNWKSVATGTYHSLALKTDGTLWAWGFNGTGQLGNNTRTNYSSPVQIGTSTDWRELHIGGQGITSGAIKYDGTLWTWGQNQFGNLGNDNRVYYSSPVQIGSMTDWKNIALNQFFSAAIKTDGTLWTWGKNDTGQLGNNNGVYYSSPIQIGSLTNWYKIAGGGSSSGSFGLAIKTDGTLWSWGTNNFGQLGLNNLTNYSSPVQIGILNNWKQISCGYNHWLAVKTDGTVWGCGYNRWGNLGNNSTRYYSSPIQIGSLTNWKYVAAGGNNSLLLTFSDLS